MISFDGRRSVAEGNGFVASGKVKDMHVFQVEPWIVLLIVRHDVELSVKRYGTVIEKVVEKPLVSSIIAGGRVHSSHHSVKEGTRRCKDQHSCVVITGILGNALWQPLDASIASIKHGGPRVATKSAKARHIEQLVDVVQHDCVDVEKDEASHGGTKHVKFGVVPNPCGDTMKRESTTGSVSLNHIAMTAKELWWYKEKLVTQAAQQSLANRKIPRFAWNAWPECWCQQH